MAIRQPHKLEKPGSTPGHRNHGNVAQLVEQNLHTVLVTGSNPVFSTKQTIKL